MVDVNIMSRILIRARLEGILVGTWKWMGQKQWQDACGRLDLVDCGGQLGGSILLTPSVDSYSASFLTLLAMLIWDVNMVNKQQVEVTGEMTSVGLRFDLRKNKDPVCASCAAWLVWENQRLSPESRLAWNCD